MPFLNPEIAIKAGFKHFGKKKKPYKEKPEEELNSIPNQGDLEIIEIPDDNEIIADTNIGEVQELDTKTFDLESNIDSIQLRSPSESYLSADSRIKDIDGQSKSSSDSAGSYLSEDPQESDKNLPDDVKIEEKILANPKTNLNAIVNEVIKAVTSTSDKASNDKVQVKANKTSDRKDGGGKIGDRRRNTWLPCTCPQYKVSCELATKCNAQAIFFAKMMVVKVIQLFIINLVIFGVAYNRDSTLNFFLLSHDWTYLAFGIFIVLFTCVRITMSYRARWPKYVALIGTIPLTAIIAFICACVTVIYNSILIPLVTATVLLTFLMLMFTPYLLHKFVMHRITNFAGLGLTTVSAVILLFLKELEAKEITYIQFFTNIWLPALLLSQTVVMISILEIQRMLFGLSFNVSTKRWHIAALYL